MKVAVERRHQRPRDDAQDDAAREDPAGDGARAADGWRDHWPMFDGGT